jgi:hypothetical protein
MKDLTKTKPYKDIDNTCMLELRRSGHTVAPPSIHVSGEPIAWAGDITITEIDGAKLERITDTIAAATLLARHWPEQGSRHEASVALGGGLSTSLGYQRAEDTLLAIL